MDAVERPAVLASLTGMSVELEGKGLPLQAVKCMEAAVSAEPPFLPQFEAQARARLAHLLMKYTHNVREAKGHLMKAFRSVETLPVPMDFKCALLSELSNCHGALGSTVQQMQLLEEGCDLVHLGRTTYLPQQDHAKHVAWLTFFKAKQAQVLLSGGQSTQALELLTAASTDLVKHEHWNHNLEIHVCIAQIHLMDDNLEQARRQIEMCGKLLGKCKERYREEGTTKLTDEAELHVLLLSSILHSSCGSAGEAKQALDKLATAMEGFRLRAVVPAVMPMDMLDAMHGLLRACLLRLSGEYKQAGQLQESAVTSLGSALREAGGLGEGGGGLTIIPAGIMHSPLLYLAPVVRLLLSQSAAAALLSQCKLSNACEEIAKVVELCGSLPGTLALFEPSVHLLAGSWLMLCGDLLQASKHFAAAAGKPGACKRTRGLATIQMCLASLEEGHVDTERASEMLQAASVLSGEEGDSTLCLLSRAALRLLQNDPQSAKVAAQEALALANATGSHQLIVLALVEYAKALAAQGVTSQAGESAEAAASLAVNLIHIPSLLAALEVCMATSNEEKRSQASKQHARTLKRWVREQESAQRDMKKRAKIACWGLGPQAGQA